MPEVRSMPKTVGFNMPMGEVTSDFSKMARGIQGYKAQKAKSQQRQDKFRQKQYNNEQKKKKEELKPEFFKPKGPINAPTVLKPSDEMPRPTLITKGVQGAKSNPQYQTWKAQVRDYQANTSAQQFARPNVSSSRFPEKIRVPGARGAGNESNPAQAQAKANELAGIRKYNIESGFAGSAKKTPPVKTAGSAKPKPTPSSKTPSAPKTTAKPATKAPPTKAPAAKAPAPKAPAPKAPGPKRA